MDLIDDLYEEVVHERQLPTKAQQKALKNYIKDIIRNAGGKYDFAEACKLCLENFSGVFTWGEVEGLLQDLQKEYDDKRAARLAINRDGYSDGYGI